MSELTSKELCPGCGKPFPQECDWCSDDIPRPPPKCTGAPARIYLVVGDIEMDCKWDDLAGVTWCTDRQYDPDIEYVRADLQPTHEPPVAPAFWVVLDRGIAAWWSYDPRERGIDPKGDVVPLYKAAQPPPVEYDRDKYPTACLAVEARIDEYVQDYEQVGEDEQGRDSCYTPTGQERSLILDAIVGLHADEDFVTLVAAEHAERQAFRTAEGRCLKCGAGGGQHWGHCSGLTK